MPKTEEQYKEIREARKQSIKDAALELFADHGYHSTSMSEIAKKAKVSKGLIYNYFISKHDLLLSIMKDIVFKTWVHFDPNKDGILTDEEFVYYIEENFKLIKENVTEWKLYSAIALQPSVQKEMDGDFDEFAVEVMQILLAFFKDRNCKDPEGEILFFASLMKGATIQYIYSPKMFPIEKFKNILIEFYTTKLNLKL